MGIVLQMKHDSLHNIRSDKDFHVLANMILRETDPYQAGIPKWLKDYRRENLPNIMRRLPRIQAAAQWQLSVAVGLLYLLKTDEYGNIFDYGLVSCGVVTDAGVAFLVDCMHGDLEPESMRYHGIGTGTNNELAADTALQTELTTVYNPDNTRATGSLTEGATANVFRSVGTNAVDGSATITEHGLFAQAAVGGGTMLDRSKFTGIGLTTGNTLQSTYDFTITSGS